MLNECFWKDDGYISGLPLQEDLSAEYLIVGGGISGLAVAYFLLQEGVRDIVVIEKDTVGSGSTGRSAGMIVCEPETAQWPELEERYGIEETRTYRGAEIQAFDVLKRIVSKGNIDCDFAENQLLFLGGKGNALACSHILADFAARRRIGLSPTLLKEKSLKDEFTSSSFSIGEDIGKGISANPLKLIHGIAQYLRSEGVKIYEHTPLRAVEPNRAVTPEGSVSFSHIVYALGCAEHSSHVQNWATTIAVTAPITDAALTRIGLLDHDMFLDDEEGSFHYGKITADQRLLLGYGDEKSEDGPSAPLCMPHIENIRAFLCTVFPTETIPIEYAWTGVYSLSRSLLPSVQIEAGNARIGGAGLWIDSIVSASYVTAKLMGKQHPLDTLFTVSAEQTSNLITERI